MKHMNNNQGRINYLDSAKGIGIILVCIGHSITNAPVAADSDCSIFLQFISQFHMPLFFLLSGMVYSDRYSEHPVGASLKKFKAYYIPFVVYNMIFVVLHNIMYKAHIFTERYDVKAFLKTAAGVLTMHIQDICGAMWFLRCLLTIVLLYIWLRYIAGKVCGGRYREYITAFAVIIMGIISIAGLCPGVFAMDRTFYYMIFFYAGHLIRRHNIIDLIGKYCIYIFAAGLAANIFTAFNFTYAIGTGCGGYLPILRYVMQFLGCFMVLAAVQWKPLAECRLLTGLGKKSLDIMALHFACFKPVSYIIIRIYDMDIDNMLTIPVIYGVSGLWPVAYVAAGLAIPAAVRCLYDRVKMRIVKGV